MRVENQSAHHPTRQLLKVIDFVSEHCQYGDLATLQLLDLKSPKQFTGGYTYKHRPDVCELSLIAPSLIVLQLSHGAAYPATSIHVEEVGPVTVQSFDEEFLLVLGHEGRHVDQMNGAPVTDEHEAELDAETFAVQLLAKWRVDFPQVSKVTRRVLPVSRR